MNNKWGILQKNKFSVVLGNFTLTEIFQEKIIPKGVYSDYNKSDHPYHDIVKKMNNHYIFTSSYYFDTEALIMLLSYLENFLESELQKLIDTSPKLEKDSPFYGESIVPKTVSFRGKTLTSDIMIHKDFREVWQIFDTLKALQDEIDKEGGLFLVCAENIEDKKGI